MSSPGPEEPRVSHATLASIAERRLREQPPQPSAAQMAAEHERRQTFRRMIDPGITRPNAKEQAFSSLRTLSTIAENLLREPENPKFQQFKPTNTIIKRDLMDPKGTLEYAIELGFRPEVKNFQPFYAFNSRKMNDLRIGAAILKEFIDLETEKMERATRSKKEEKAVAEAAAYKVKLAFMDDRKSKMLLDEREREIRNARAQMTDADRQAEQSSRISSPASVAEGDVPSSGHTLGSSVDVPPPYEADKAEPS
ncbi:hypothetical protein BD779DRAFT_1491522 [Infundibulicybe gibba]|nr:hypothetical protein BD779DRAFT_1491522 [Infundibulicybe gibba]